MSGFSGFLAGRALEVEPLDLTERGSVPKDATMIVVAGPVFDLHDAEARELDRWLSGGGKMLVLFDLPTFDESVSFTNLATLLRKHGLDDNGLKILDYLGLRRKNQLSAVALLSYSPTHMITAPLRQSADLIFVADVRALTPAQPLPKGLKIEALVGSSPDAWTSPWHESQVTPPRAGERGQQIVGWAVEEPGQGRSGMRLAVFGSSEFVKNRFWRVSQTSQNLMLNTVNWLIEQEDLISVPPRTVEGTPLELDDEELRLVFILIVLALPALLFFGGVTYARVIRRG